MTRSLATRIKGQFLLVLLGISVGIGPLAPEGSTEAGMVTQSSMARSSSE